MSEPRNHSSSDPLPPPRRGCGWIFFAFMLVVGSAWGASLGVFVWFVDNGQHTIEALEVFRPSVGSKLYSAPTADTDGLLLGEFISAEKRQVVRLVEIPLYAQKAFLAAEDHLFYEHRGVRPLALAKAVLEAPQTGRLRGASTITQQVVRNIDTLGVGLDVTYARKLREWIAALQIERAFTKDEILEIYLNKIFLGISAYGVEAASRQYFGKSSVDLTLGEAATLAGLTRSPNRYEPIHNPRGARLYRNLVLNKMLEEGFISQEEHAQALEEDLEATVAARHARRDAQQGMALNNRFQAPYFAEDCRLFLQREYGKDVIESDGLEIHTTIDMRLQAAAEEILEAALVDFDEKKRAYLKARGREDEFVPVPGALVCIDNREPHQGFVRAMVGGRNFEDQNFNNATQALRQPGSSIKPFVWMAALDNGFTPSSVVIDAPYRRVDAAGQVWTPKNFDAKFNGPMAIRTALEKSVNIISIKLVDQIGIPTLKSYLDRCGIPADVNGPSIALGVHEVTVLQHCVAFSVFANMGIRYDPVLITEIYDRDGLQQYDYRDHQRKEKALEPDAAYVTVSLLKGACLPDYSIGHSPTGARSAALKHPHGGKTGTTNNSRNVWFCGFTPQYTTVVWMGYQDNRPLGAGIEFTGGRLATPIWTDFMLVAHEGLEEIDFEVPYGIEFHNIHRIRGTAGGPYKEAYLTRGEKPPRQWYGDIHRPVETVDLEFLMPIDLDSPLP